MVGHSGVRPASRARLVRGRPGYWLRSAQIRFGWQAENPTRAPDRMVTPALPYIGLIFPASCALNKRCDDLDSTLSRNTMFGLPATSV